ncbi:MAG TPA: ABC transporter permease [Verrucomicrobiae bacterium]|jgi:putative ABC transport system permease protein|nr:ABC transporter permease [Verrucomicrobiae bacterium]
MNFFTELKEGLAIAWDAIRANKMRSLLTTLGIIIGIVTVTLMGTAIDSMNKAFHKNIAVIGVDTLFVNRIGWIMNSEVDWQKMLRRPSITREQARAVETQMTGVRGVAPRVDITQTVRYKDKTASGVHVIGTTDQFLAISSFSIGEGRFISPAEAQGGRPVCIIGLDVATNFFATESPLGKTLRIGARKLEVIGVLEKQGTFLGLESLDNEVIIPVQQLMIGYWRDPDFSIQAKVNNVAEMDNEEEELRGIMRKVRHIAPGEPDDFTINRQEQFVSLFNSVAGTIAAVGLVITGLSLFVGGIGIMNIMFVSVAERTREIGVRKAIGAKRRTILLQFLIEAATICLLGGLVGLVLTYGATLAISQLLIEMNMSLPIMGLAILVSLLTGVVSGFLPAWRAARMDPVEALRNE